MSHQRLANDTQRAHCLAGTASGPSSTWLKTKHAEIGAFPVVGYVPNGSRIAALLVAESNPARLVGRVPPKALISDSTWTTRRT
jgi:hypothetical protein